MNYLTEQFEENLHRLINESGLPACVVRLVLQQTLQIVIEQEKQFALQEQSERSDDNGTELHEDNVG